MQISEQLTTDFEKALYSTRAPVTVALGMTGRRFDHTLAALDAVTRHASKRMVVMVDEEDVALALTEKFSFTVAAGERVSIHPLLPVKFWRSDGLKYPLDAITLAPGVRTGTSNEALTGPFTIVPEEGIHAPYLLIPATHLSRAADRQAPARGPLMRVLFAVLAMLALRWHGPAPRSPACSSPMPARAQCCTAKAMAATRRSVRLPRSSSRSASWALMPAS